MKFLNMKENKELLAFSYKILHDILAFSFIAFFLSLALESALPGMVSENNGFIILGAIIIASALSIAKLGEKLGIKYEKKTKHNFFPIMLALAFAFIGNSLLKFKLWENLIITVSVMMLFFLFYQIIFSPEE